MDTYQHIRNATAKVHYASKTFLIDPMLGAKDSFPGFQGTLHSEIRNPTVELPMSVNEILADVDAIIVTHTHTDHWESTQHIPKHLPIFTQHEHDAQLIRDQGFTNVRILSAHEVFEGVLLSRTGCTHGTPDMFKIPQLAEALGSVMGIVFQASNHPTLYLAADTVWEEHVDAAIKTYQPDYLVLNAGNALFQGFDESIIMGKKDVCKACQVTRPNTKVIAVHLEAINHCVLTRLELSQYIQANDVANRVVVPADGEVINLRTL